ncbi:MAG: carbohydrate kinase family protein [Candidatus Wildermuthbacteria bacterium]|nr:carbohydrate kinase family protein [Candidatus Wildermuthbacteria bacterium]
MAKFDLISIGDTQYDVFLELEEKTKLFQEDTQQYLGVAFPEKIPAKKYTAVPAVGNSANVAIGARRLGLKTAFYTHLGYDHVGKEEIEIFKKEGVATDYIVWDKEKGSNFSAVLNFQGDRTIIVHHEHRAYKLPKLSEAKWIYFSSLAEGHEVLHQEIPEYVKKTGAKLGFNPGSFQMREGLEAYRELLKVTTVLFVNKQEAQTLLGIQEQDEKALLEGLKAWGPEIVIITDNGNGSYAFDGKEYFHRDIFKVPVIEMTGAGDAYSTGFICALAYGKDIQTAMTWGAANAASVIGYIGAREGLLKKDELEKKIHA